MVHVSHILRIVFVFHYHVCTIPLFWSPIPISDEHTDTGARANSLTHAHGTLSTPYRCGGERAVSTMNLQVHKCTLHSCHFLSASYRCVFLFAFDFRWFYISFEIIAELLSPMRLLHENVYRKMYITFGWLSNAPTWLWQLAFAVKR